MRSSIVALLLVLGGCNASRPVSDNTTDAEAANETLPEPATTAEKKPEVEALESYKGAVSSTSKSMSFSDCLGTIEQVATQFGTAPINIVETTQVRMVRFNTSDGSVLVTCSAPDHKMVITRSPHRG